MKKTSIIAAICGSIEWHRIIKIDELTMIAILPDNNKELSIAMREAVIKHCHEKCMNYSQVMIVCTNCNVKQWVDGINGLQLRFLVLSDCKMRRLVSYIKLTNKPYGATCNRLVKLISLEEPHCGQLKYIAREGIFPLESLVKNMMINLE